MVICSDRTTLSSVTAKNQIALDVKNAVFGVKRLIWLHFRTGLSMRT